MNFVVERSSWERSYLYNPVTKDRSVLGFLGQTLGFCNKTLQWYCTPQAITNNKIWSKGILDENGYNSSITDQIMYVETRIDYNSFQRENKITNLFNELNIEVLFED